MREKAKVDGSSVQPLEEIEQFVRGPAAKMAVHCQSASRD